MKKAVLAIYDYLSTHKAIYRGILFGLIAVCTLLVCRLDYKEDISDFLPLSAHQKQAMDIYQKISGAERIVIIFEGGQLDDKLNAIDDYARALQKSDSTLSSYLTTQIDMQQYLDVLHWVYMHIPYFLTEEDYVRIDSLLAIDDIVAQSMANNKRILQMPVSSFMHRSIGDDPLALFAPIVSSLQQFQPIVAGFSSFDGYMLTEDEQMAFAFLQTPYGANETQKNTHLIDQLNSVGKDVSLLYPGVSIRLLGAPVVAVGNASRIKKDSLIAVGLAIILIALVLLYCFRHEHKSILFILLTIGFGWLFGMAVTSLICKEVSLIVLGIGSIIIGIAVNYPLHILFHRRYTGSVRQALQEVISPLIIGNITTVGAFLTLVPLKAEALKDLGIFAASMLIGTILFSIIFLPQLMRFNYLKDEDVNLNIAEQEASRPMTRTKRFIGLAVLAIFTVGFYWVGKDITFDADVSHMNYMTSQQRADFAYFTALAGETESETVYVIEPQSQITNVQTIASINGVESVLSVWRWLPDEKEQQRRIRYWNQFWQERRETLIKEVLNQAQNAGFRHEAFHSFIEVLEENYQPLPFEDFESLATSMLKGYYAAQDDQRLLVTRVSVRKEQAPIIEQRLKETISASGLVFDIRSLNKSVANQLSDNFDYIGWACSLLVFFFLWATMRSWRAALVSFIPMAVSWIWILGIMHIFGLQFNIVNIILATFIFGQGDDYTIFVVEGLQHEYRTGKQLLPQFRNSILLSAIIMFLGIGVLIIAKHPAMHSLGLVTLIGMSVVILTANVIPPLLRELLFGKSKN